MTIGGGVWGLFKIFQNVRLLFQLDEELMKIRRAMTRSFALFAVTTVAAERRPPGVSGWVNYYGIRSENRLPSLRRWMSMTLQKRRWCFAKQGQSTEYTPGGGFF